VPRGAKSATNGAKRGAKHGMEAKLRKPRLHKTRRGQTSLPKIRPDKIRRHKSSGGSRLIAVASQM
jgi:hypothetical protein